MSSPDQRLAARREFLRRTVLVGAGLLGGIACAPAVAPAAPTTAPAPAPAAAVASPTAAGSLASSPVAVASPSAVAPAVSSGPLTHVHGAWIAKTSKALIWPLALDAGYFEKYGLDFQLDFINGSSNAAASLISGSIDMASTTGTGVISAQAAGQDIIMIAGFINQLVYRVMARSDISAFDDLRGKPIGISRLGQSDYFVWQSILQKLGWPVDAVTYVAGGDQAGEQALLQQGQTYAIAATPPLDLAAAQIGAHQVLDTTTMDIPDQDVGFVVSRSYLAANRTTALNVLKASIEAMARWQRDQPFTEGVIQKYLETDDQALLDDGYTAYAPLWPRAPFPSPEGLAKEIEEVSVQNPAAAQLTVDRLMDTSLVQELVDSGFVQQIYGSE